jgi:hypothetical protein
MKALSVGLPGGHDPNHGAEAVRPRARRGRHDGAAEGGNVPDQAGSFRDFHELHRPRVYYSQRPIEVKRRPKYYGLP